MSIPFTQFLRPDGRRVPVEIDRAPEIEAKAYELIEAGYAFEIEILRTGDVSMAVYRDRDESVLSVAISMNGPPVLDAVDQMVQNAHQAMVDNFAKN